MHHFVIYPVVQHCIILSTTDSAKLMIYVSGLAFMTHMWWHLYRFNLSFFMKSKETETGQGLEDVSDKPKYDKFLTMIDWFDD